MLLGNVTHELLLIDANDCQLSSLCFLQITVIISFVKAAEDSMMYLIAVNMLSKYKIIIGVQYSIILVFSPLKQLFFDVSRVITLITSKQC